MARPREFDTDEALAAITDVFCEKGYEGASLSDLVAATGLGKGSLYAAFGDKRGMYRAALARYDRQQIGAAVARLRAPGSARERIGRLLAAAVERATGRGCLLCSAANDQAAADTATAEALGRSTARLEAAIFDALADAPVARDETARRCKARELLALYFGLRVLSRMALPAGVSEDAAAAGLAGLV